MKDFTNVLQLKIHDASFRPNYDMKFPSSLAFKHAPLLALLVSFPLLNAAEISGKITLTGTPPPEIQLPLDAVCGKMHTGKVTTRHYVVGKESGLGNVFVYLKEGAPKTAATGEAPLLDQTGCLYEPYVMGVVAGQTFKVRNSDPMMHNVHATPKINSEFNFGQPLKGQVTEKNFPKPEVLVRLKCEVHAWMFAYVGVCDHPYFAVTDKDGNFTIKNVPAGNYTVEAIHLKAGAKMEKATVTKDEKKTLNFTLAVPAPK